MQKQVIILRGLPGSGKSYLAKHHNASAASDSDAKTDSAPVICSADDFFIDENGTYQFVVYNLPKAHNACLVKFVDALHSNQSPVYLDNTNTQVWEYQVYEKIAAALGYAVTIMEIRCPDEKTATIFQLRNSHGLHYGKQMQMFSRWEKDPRAVMVEPNLPSDADEKYAKFLASHKAQQPHRQHRHHQPSHSHSSQQKPQHRHRHPSQHHQPGPHTKHQHQHKRHFDDSNQQPDFEQRKRPRDSATTTDEQKEQGVSNEDADQFVSSAASASSTVSSETATIAVSITSSSSTVTTSELTPESAETTK